MQNKNGNETRYLCRWNCRRADIQAGNRSGSRAAGRRTCDRSRPPPSRTRRGGTRPAARPVQDQSPLASSFICLPWQPFFCRHQLALSPSHPKRPVIYPPRFSLGVDEFRTFINFAGRRQFFMSLVFVSSFATPSTEPMRINLKSL